MFFLHIDMLFLLIIPISLFFIVKNTHASLNAIFATEVLKQITISKETVGAKKRAIVFLLALMLLIIALARPVKQDANINVSAKITPIIIALDVSKSMLAKDIYPNRLLVAKKKVKQIVKQAKNANIGIILFAKNAFILSPISEDVTSLLYILDRFDENINFNAGSDVMATLQGAYDLFKDYKSKNIIMLSDGGNADNYDNEIEFLKENNITLYTIGLATKLGAPIPDKGGYVVDDRGKIVNVGLNEQIKNLAIQSGGGYIDFSIDDSDINAILDQIDKRAKKEQLKTHKAKTYVEYFYYPLGASLLLFLISFISISSFSLLSKQIPRSSNILAICIFLFIPFGYLKSGVLDFKHISDAKQSYNNKQYENAIKEYKKLPPSNESYYNLANAYYKAKQYENAIKYYKMISNSSKELKHNSLHNLGNSYFYLNKLDEAQKSYEEALKIRDDKQTKHNLEEIKKQKKKKKQKQDQSKSGQKQQQSKSKGKNKDNKNKKDKKSKDTKQEKNNKKKKQEQKKEKKQKKESKTQKQKKKKNNDAIKKLAKRVISPNEISTKEEKKWLKQIRSTKTPILLQKIDKKNTLNNNYQEELPW